ncbi:MAG TPA: hypothetical protein VMY77_09055 [Chitinophagaceae bacterium]|nr:hypothetical protein [Chitinophagaceae bacterium]
MQILILADINISSWIILAGIGQIALVLGSLAIPKILKWKDELNKVQPLIRQIFWTYAGYILITNLYFGLVSVLATKELIDGSVLACAITGFITLYWFSRVAIQFFYFDRSSFPPGRILLIGEILLVTLFVFLTLVYGWSFYLNLKG